MSLVLRVAAVALLACSGCSTPSTWVRSRAADFADIVPFSFAFGWGLGVAVKATPLFGLGITVMPNYSNRWGYEDRYFNGFWSEFEVGLPYSLWVESFDDVPETPETRWELPLLYRFQAFRDAPSGEGERNDFFEPGRRSWGRHPPVVRESVGAFLLPEGRHWLEYDDLRLELGDTEPMRVLTAPDRATLWETRRRSRPAGRAWDLFEAGVLAGPIGVRIGVRPIEAVDFVLGILFIDVLFDDLPAPEEFEPVPVGPLSVEDTPPIQ